MPIPLLTIGLEIPTMLDLDHFQGITLELEVVGEPVMDQVAAIVAQPSLVIHFMEIRDPDIIII